MREISFGEFFEAVKDRIPLERVKDLNGSHDCFEHEGTYLSMYYHAGKNGIWLSWIVGSGIGWAREIKEACKRGNIAFVGFMTKTDNKAVNSLAKYWKASIIKQEGDFVHYEIAVKEAR